MATLNALRVESSLRRGVFLAILLPAGLLLLIVAIASPLGAPLLLVAGSWPEARLAMGELIGGGLL